MELARLKLMLQWGNYCIRRTHAFWRTSDRTGTPGPCWVYTTMLCTEQLGKFVDFPKGAPRIDVVLHNRPARDRMKLSELDDELSMLDVDGEVVRLSFGLAAWLAKHMPASGVVYAQIEYGAGENR